MQRILMLTGALAALFALAGCPPAPPPGGSGTTGSGKPTEGTKQTAQGSATGAMVHTDYRFPLPDDAKSLDPAQITDTISDTVARRVYDTLVRFSPEGGIVDDLADSHTISADGLTYTFKLHPGVKFHNGDALTSADVLSSYQRLLDPATKAPRANLLDYVKGAEDYRKGKSKDVPGLSAPDPQTFVITLDKPYSPFLNILCMTTFGVVSKQAGTGPTTFSYDPQTKRYVQTGGKSIGDNPVGTGPFVFQSWDRDSKITLTANPDYFRGAPHIKTLIFRIIKDENTRFEEFKSGGLEHCDLPPSQIQAVMADPKLKAMVSGVAAMDMYGYAFNCEQAPFKDNAALRLALNYAVDKQNIVKNIWGGLVTEQKTYVPEGMFYFNAQAEGYPYNVDKAKQLLTQAGYPDGKGLPELVLNVDLQPTNKLVAQAVQEDLRKVGVNVRIETTAWGPFLDKVYAGQALFFQNTWLADYPDPDNWLFQLLDSGNFGDKGNIARWQNSEFDKLVESAQVEPSQQSRADLYKNAEKIASDEAPWLLLLVQPYVHGLSASRLDRSPQLGNVPLEQVTLD
jgi:peptide/nickel transport system substrate-binding protein/oligopeptide transport system substrate-binding protein